MSTHVPSSSSVCIHAICVAPEYRRKGIGLGLLREYIVRLEAANAATKGKDGKGKYERVLLITHEELKPFYELAGFKWVGRSEVIHGSKPWFEMCKTLSSASSAQHPTNSSSAQGDPQFPPGLWAALHHPSPLPSHTTSRTLSSFNNNLPDVCNPENQTNKYDLLCPREGCGSVILKASVGTLRERTDIQVTYHSLKKNKHPTVSNNNKTFIWAVRR